MPSLAKASRSTIQPRIHWTRARARAAQAIEREPPVANSDLPIAVGTSSSTRKVPPVEEAEDPVAGPHMRKLKAEIALELGEEVTIVGEEWTKSLYAEVVGDTALDAFLASVASGYRQDEGRWANLPKGPSEVSELYEPIFDIVSHIISELGEPCGEGATRVVVNSHTSRFTQPKFKALCPDISIKATGASFQRGREIDDYLDGVGYASVASVFDVRLEGRSNDIDQAIQAGFYCRQIFMRQPNRNFVRSLVITEHSVRMLHYDRSGFYLTPLIDIHNNPRTFIRLVLGLSSPDESVLGLDTSIQWTINPATGMKTAGIIKTVDADGQPITYNLDMGRPPFYRGSIFGRGTTCWYANHSETGSDVVIKDIWRTRGKTSECDFLAAAQGVDGVVQMISFQDRCAETLAYRPPDFSTNGFEPRVKSRTTMPHYGKSIQHFTSRYQAISALRDALAGYRALRAKGILHRDVSSHNILLGSSGGARGCRGVLIDLDMAAWTWDLTRLRAETGLGQRRYQSHSVLYNHRLSLPPRHDHLDDLESFFHVLCNLVLLYEAPGKISKETEEEFALCDVERVVTAGNAKINFMCYPIAIQCWWGDPCRQLFGAFQSIVDNIGQQKHTFYLDRELTPEAKRDGMEAIAEEKEDIYDKVIELFDEALADIEAEDAGSTTVPATTSADSPAEQPPTVTNLKRCSGEEHPDAPPPKRPSPTCPKDSESFEQEDLVSPGLPVSPIGAGAVAPAIDHAPAPTIPASPIVPSDEVKAGTSLKRRLDDDTLDNPPPPKRSRPSKPAAPPKPRKRALKAPAALPPPPQGVRRSARLNRC
ncbi:hypothetical protein DFP72DRAFT_55005 [Ephemerocybe angulata]|uniref:Fungal-type protein kinase domain-containing protein n=1 Tax=Ephemerocybe angulata TaxID=980116 RepID=A0A8H6IA68_9AGAR|nr:hypothetical protein DFP72DRAFT_55005 [Tulosesus angulatus]